ncbi:MAG: xylulokinase, partial [Thermoprotei archaeon]
MVNKSKYIAAFDIGTTSIKCSVIDINNFEPIAKASTKSIINYPKKGWAEQDPNILWESIISTFKETIEKIMGKESISAIIFGAHMAGIVPVDKSGNPLRSIIIWLDERAAGLPRELWKGLIKLQGYSIFRLIKFLRITGGAPSKTGKDVISKIIWMKENEPDIFNKTYKFLDVKGYLINKCTNKFITSPDEANLSWLADTKHGKAKWSLELLKDYKLSVDLFPEIKQSTEIAGRLSKEAAVQFGIGDDVPVIVGAGDITSAAIGSGAVKEGELHIYVGTSDWIAGHISKRKVDVFHYVGSLLSAIPNKYLLIAEQEVAAGSLEWMMSMLGMEKDYEKVDKLVRETNKTDILFLPWFYGERSPIDNPFVRGGLLNLTLDTKKEEILRSIMEGVALNIKWAYPYVEKMTEKQQEIINIVGGGALFDLWCQLIADSIRKPVRRISNPQLAGVRG